MGIQSETTGVRSRVEPIAIGSLGFNAGWVSSSSPPPSSFRRRIVLVVAVVVANVVRNPPQHRPPGTPTPVPHLLVTNPASVQTPRSSFARTARFASTGAKQQTLKERLAELIPKELENVRLPACLLALNPDRSRFIRSKLSVLSTAKSPSGPFSLTSFTGMCLDGIWITSYLLSLQRHERFARSHLGWFSP